MVDAVYNPNNPYKWTSTRVQVIEDRGKPYPSKSLFIRNIIF